MTVLYAVAVVVLVALVRGIQALADAADRAACTFANETDGDELCRFGEHEWQGSFIGERFCFTHGGHSVAETPGAVCPRANGATA